MSRNVIQAIVIKFFNVLDKFLERVQHISDGVLDFDLTLGEGQTPNRNNISN